MQHVLRQRQQLRSNRQTGKRAGGESAKKFAGPGTLLKYRWDGSLVGEIHAEDRLKA